MLCILSMLPMLPEREPDTERLILSREGTQVNAAMQLRPLLLLLLLSPWAQMAAADQTEALPPLPFAAVYRARVPGLPLAANLRLGLTREKADTWLLESVIGIPGARIRESSLLTLDRNGGRPPGVRPLGYTYTRSGLGRKRRVRIDFDWRRLRSRSELDGRVREEALTPGMLDRLSCQLQLRLDLLEHYRPGAAARFNYQLLDRKGRRNWSFAVAGEEAIDTPLGRLATVRLVRTDRDGGTTSLWLARDWQFLLVRLLQEDEDGDSFQLQLREARLGDEILTGLPD